MLREHLAAMNRIALWSQKYVEEIVRCGPNKYCPVILIRRLRQITAPDAACYLFEATPPRTKCSKCCRLNRTVNFRNSSPYVVIHYRELEAPKHRRPVATSPLPQRPGS